jgi:hypothetical protein
MGSKKPDAADKTEPGSIVVAETATSTWNYHLRRVGSDGRLYQTGGAPPALCGVALGWDTKIPVTAWGSKSHLPQTWCMDCAKVASEELMRATYLPALEIMKKGLEIRGWLSTSSARKLSVGGRTLHKTPAAAAKHAREDLEAWEDTVVRSGSVFYVGRVMRATSMASGTFMEIWAVDGLTPYEVGKDGRSRRQVRRK